MIFFPGKQKVDKLEVHESYPAARKSKKTSPVQYPVPYGKYIEPGNSDIRRQDLLKKYKVIKALVFPSLAVHPINLWK